MTTLLRDIQCSQDVGHMAALGKFDREFTVHGCAYRQNGETFYRIYEQADALYHYCETNDLRGLCTTLPQSHTLRTGVPSGTEDTLWQEIKWQLEGRFERPWLQLFDRCICWHASLKAWESKWC